MTSQNQEMLADRDEQAALWCISLAESELPHHEQQQFDRWIADPDNARALEEVSRLWNSVEMASDLPELIQIRGQALENFRRANKRRWTRPPSALRYWVGACAAVLLVAVASLFFVLSDPVLVLKTGIGERRVAMLEDGSRVSLDADSTVEVRLRDNRRELKLVSGRAMFEVAKDPLRPFAVTAGNRIVVATGTAFSVEMLNRHVHVLLYEGHVAVLDSNRSTPTQIRVRNGLVPAGQMLTPGRELVVGEGDGGLATLAATDPARSLSWETGQLSFDDEPLAAAVERMNRYSKVKLAIDDPAIGAIRVNGVYTAGDVDAFVEGVTALNPVRAARGNDRIKLSGR